jgi:putative oxidoreductase
MSKEGMKDDPAPVQVIAAAGELAAGLGLILGVLTPFAAAGLAAIMGGALLKVHIPNRSPIVAPPGKPSAETSIDYLFASLLLIALGPGKFSLDAWLRS